MSFGCDSWPENDLLIDLLGEASGRSTSHSKTFNLLAGTNPFLRPLIEHSHQPSVFCSVVKKKTCWSTSATNAKFTKTYLRHLESLLSEKPEIIILPQLKNMYLGSTVFCYHKYLFVEPNLFVVLTSSSTFSAMLSKIALACKFLNERKEIVVYFVIYFCCNILQFPCKSQVLSTLTDLERRFWLVVIFIPLHFHRCLWFQASSKCSMATYIKRKYCYFSV